MIGNAPCLNVFRVEHAGADDLDDVMQVMGAAFDPRFGEAWTRPQCAGILPMSGVSLNVARSPSGAVAGFCLFRSVADEAELLLLAVDPGQRRQGVGRKLLRSFINSVARNGVSLVHLEVRANNPAIALYSAEGFSEVGRRRDYYSGANGALFDALTFARSI